MSIGSDTFQGLKSRKSQPALQIGAWKADPNLDEISNDGRTVKLEPRTMRLLLYLAANRNRVVGLTEMLDEIWPYVVVTPQSVYSSIAQLRQILGDSTESPKYIATVPRKGYRLVAAVAEHLDAAPMPPTVAPREMETVPTIAAVDGLNQPPVELGGGRRLGNRSAVIVAVIVAVIAAVGLTAFLYVRLHQSASVAAAGAGAARSAETPVPVPVVSALPTSVAVLPFLDLSGKKDFEYFTDGLTEELIDLLAHNTSLRVPARTSSFYFKGKAAPVAEIAKQLAVTHLLEGSVRRSGNTVRITAQLIRAADGYHLWSETFDRSDTNDLAVEDDIAGKVAETLRTKLTPRAQSGVSDLLDNESRNLLLECQFYLARNTPDDAVKAVDCFKKLVDANPNNARAWSSYANALLLRPHLVRYDDDGTADNVAAVKAARQALSLDPNSSSAHATLANYLLDIEHNWVGADREIKLALASDPDDPITLLAAGMLDAYLGRIEEWIRFCDLARIRDPLNFRPYARAELGYLYLGRYAEAEAAARKRLDISPDGSGAHSGLAVALALQNRGEEALAEIAQERDAEQRLWGIAIIYQTMGRRQQADAAYAEALSKLADIPIFVAELNAFRGDRDRALAALDKGASLFDRGVLRMKSDFMLRSLHDDPRYKAILVRLGIPD
jgi:TolB-like protein/DNA-binding winged helix-turn-helix (wHTH) protein/Flp pilus assembly protein TadD